MTLVQKIKRLRDLLRDPAVSEALEHALPGVIEERLGDLVVELGPGRDPREVTVANVLDVLSEAAELAEENAIEAKVEKGMNRR